jgi:5-formyltetrahydrofolate cyclo-ligase
MSLLMTNGLVRPSPSLSFIKHVQTLSFHTTMATGQQLKAQMRARIKDSLTRVSATAVETQSIAAQNVIMSMPGWKQAKRVGIYLCMPTSEAQTYALVRDAFKHDKAVFVPYIHAEFNTDARNPDEQADAAAKPPKKKKVMSMLRLNSLNEYENLESDSWNIPTLPKADLDSRENAKGSKSLAGVSSGEDQGGLDVIVMPGVAFDHHMNRTGHGAGYYDKFLTDFCKDQQRQKPLLGKISNFCNSVTVILN